ncbi:MAG: sugar ABC transporter ATP-binding protein [Truepera sp.]|jgi:ABC-type sugar transport system ATPase subunit|nr:sugar ABC transporter ATP-binding protein [Truepera sp.]
MTESGAYPPLWRLDGVSKRFYSVRALTGIDVVFPRGEVHALVGENGSGKSTLVKCLAGVHRLDEGALYHDGSHVTLGHPLDARAHGVATIFQEFSLVPTLSVAENVFLGRQPVMHGPWVDWDRMREETSRALGELGSTTDPDTIVGHLSVADQQLVEIAKAISLNSTLLILDEPTAALGYQETERLLGLVRDLARQGKAILYISHRLDEVFRVADRITVLKDGRLVATKPIQDVDMNSVVHMMVGRDIEQHYPKQSSKTNRVRLAIRALTTERGVDGVSFDVCAGEVFGLGGMVGAGRTEIARALFGLDRVASGSIELDGTPVSIGNPDEAIAAGIGLVPENRKADGLFFNFDGPRNITTSKWSRIMRGLVFDLAREREVGRSYVDSLKITPTAMSTSVRFLSGGNQQKVVIARWLYSEAKVLILDEPTQGIDVGAKLDVYGVINDLAAQGVAIILISSDYPELLAMSDRIAVIRNGTVVTILPADEMTEHRLIAIASGAEVPPEPPHPANRRATA